MTMLLTVAEAATALGCSPRAVRARLARGEIKGQKQDGQRRIPRGHMPLTEAQHRTLQARADTIRELVEVVLLPQLAQRLPGSRDGFADLSAFRAGGSILADLPMGVRPIMAGQARFETRSFGVSPSRTAPRPSRS